MKNSTIIFRTLCFKCLFLSAISIFCLCDLQKVMAQDMGATVLIAPYSTVCADTNQSVVVTIKNYDTQAINFAINPVNITVNITGASVQTFSKTLSSGTLAAGSTLNIQVATTANLSVSGIHIFNAQTTLAGDINTSNDAMPALSVYVNRIPVITATPSSQTICSGTAASIALSCDVIGSTFSWTVVQNNVTGATSGTGSSIFQTLTTTGPNIGVAIYTITPSANGCMGTPIEDTVTVDLGVNVIASTSSQSICSGGSTSISLSSSTQGTNYSWTVSQTGATGALAGSGSAITQTLTTTGTTAGKAIYSIIGTHNSCISSSILDTITVNPIPIITSNPSSFSICSGSTASIALSSNITGTFFSRSIIQTNVTGASAGSGSLISEIISTIGTIAGNAIYTIVPSSNGCSGNTIIDTVTVNPLDDPSFAYTSATYCQTGTNPTPIVTSSSGVFSSSPAGLSINPSTGLIDLATSGLGTFTVTYSTNGICPNTSSVNITITNAPSANFSYAGSSFCQFASNPSPIFGSGASAGLFSASPAGLVFENANTGEIDLSSSLAGTYTITNTIPASGGCSASTATASIIINQAPIATPSSSSQTICSGSATSIILSSSMSGTIYGWTAVQTGVSGASTGNADSIVQNLSTTGLVTGTAIYTITTTANGCLGIPLTVMITVNPIPIATAPSSAQIICSGSTISIPLTSNVSGTTFSWIVNQTGISGASGGTGSSLIQTLTTTDTTAGTATYTITPIANSCSGTQVTAIVIVKPVPIVTTTSNVQTICSGSATSITLTSNISATSFEWSAFSTGASGNILGNGSSIIETLTTTGTVPGKVIYTITPFTSFCTGTQITDTVIVNLKYNPSFNYSSGTYCQTGTNPTPTIPGGNNGSFTSVPSGLVFANASTGEINLSTSNFNTYTVTYTTTGLCPVSSYKNITITNSLNATFSYSSPLCETGINPLPVFDTGASAGVFSATPGWLILDTISGKIDLNSTLGTYTVTNYIPSSGNCASTSSSSTIIINPSPIVSAAVNQPACLGSATQFTDSTTVTSGNIVSWWWNFGDSSPANTTQNPSHIYSSAGYYTATLIATSDSGCSNYFNIANSVANNVCNGITGNIFNDNNGNCIMDSGDQGLYNIPVKFYDNNNNLLGIKYSSGAYQFLAPLGTYNVRIDTTSIPLTIQCPYPGVDSLVTLTGGNPVVSDVNFNYVCKPGFDIGVQSILPSGWVFPGLQHQFRVKAGNMYNWYNLLNCGNVLSGQVQITITGPVTYSGIVPGALTPSITGNVFTYAIADFGAMNYWQDYFGLIFTTNTSAQFGDQICVTGVVTPNIGDNNASNNTYSYCYQVVNSYDPNLKEVYPVNVAPGYQDWFTYTIHFQNTGTAPAVNIRLADTLDANLDFETLQVINYSDTTEISLDNNMLTFNFQNIMLPDSASDQEGSKGFVQYRVKPKTNLPAGTQIKNTAYIYFDYNAPVVTNTTINEFLQTVLVNENKINASISIYPNPGNGKYYIRLTEAMKGSEININAYNIFGELILNYKTTNSLSQIDLSSQPKGIYIIRVDNINRSINQRLIKQ